MEEEKSFKRSFWELVHFALVALAIVIPIRLFIAEPYVVSGSSMVPTFEDKNYLIVDKISYILRSPQRGDVVVFRYPNDPKKFFIKRIVGLPKETVDVKGDNVLIYNKENPEGFKFVQPFITKDGNKDARTELGDEEFFVMGDNRPASLDSRFWGAVKRDLIAGRAFLRLLPIKKMGIWPGKINESE